MERNEETNIEAGKSPVSQKTPWLNSLGQESLQILKSYAEAKKVFSEHSEKAMKMEIVLFGQTLKFIVPKSVIGKEYEAQWVLNNKLASLRIETESETKKSWKGYLLGWSGKLDNFMITLPKSKMLIKIGNHALYTADFVEWVLSSYE